MYELEGDADAIMAKISEAVANGDMHMNEALDLETVAMSFWSPIGEKVVKRDGD
jgi:hypothetical protein